MKEKEIREAILKQLLEYNKQGYTIIIDCCFYDADFSCVEFSVNDDDKVVTIC